MKGAPEGAEATSEPDRVEAEKLRRRSEHMQPQRTAIPTGWRSVDLSDLCELQRGFDITEATSVPGTIPVYTSSGLAYYHSKAMVNPPGVVTGRKGLLGNVFVIREPFWPHDTTLWVKDFHGNVPDYVALVLQSFHLERLDAATSVPTLNRNNLVGHSVLLPPPDEQRAIAESLSDVDDLLEALGRLIAKQRAIKQAAMQQLLTGRTRLPGFTGPWQTGRLGQIADINVGSTPSRSNPSFWGPGHVWLSIADMKGNEVHDSKEHITDVAASTMTAVPKGALLMSFKLSIGRLAFAGRELFTNEAICSLVNLRAHPQYLFYALGRVDFPLYGTQAVKGYTLNSKSLRRIEVLLPPAPEQVAISAVLSDMDAEIEALERRRDKTRAIKQGMMQQLLTGRVRLVEPRVEGESAA